MIQPKSYWYAEQQQQTIGDDMNAAGMSVVNGFCLGTGLILASVCFKLLFHVGFCS